MEESGKSRDRLARAGGGLLRKAPREAASRGKADWDKINDLSLAKSRPCWRSLLNRYTRARSSSPAGVIEREPLPP